MMRLMTTIFLILSSTSIVAGDHKNNKEVYYGVPSILLGGQLKMQTYVILDDDDNGKNPVEIGVEMTALVGNWQPLFASLPTADIDPESDGTWDIINQHTGEIV